MTNTETTIQGVKNQIESETGFKVSIRKIKKGSMKGYIYISRRKENGVYPQFDFDYCQSKKDDINFYNVSNIIIIFIGKEVFA